MDWKHRFFWNSWKAVMSISVLASWPDFVFLEACKSMGNWECGMKSCSLAFFWKLKCFLSLLVKLVTFQENWFFPFYKMKCIFNFLLAAYYVKFFGRPTVVIHVRGGLVRGHFPVVVVVWFVVERRACMTTVPLQMQECTALLPCRANLSESLHRALLATSGLQ